jgi:hypothetical protein
MVSARSEKVDRGSRGLWAELGGIFGDFVWHPHLSFLSQFSEYLVWWRPNLLPLWEQLATQRSMWALEPLPPAAAPSDLQKWHSNGYSGSSQPQWCQCHRHSGVVMWPCSQSGMPFWRPILVLQPEAESPGPSPWKAPMLCLLLLNTFFSSEIRTSCFMLRLRTLTGEGGWSLSEWVKAVLWSASHWKPQMWEALCIRPVKHFPAESLRDRVPGRKKHFCLFMSGWGKVVWRKQLERGICALECWWRLPMLSSLQIHLEGGCLCLGLTWNMRCSPFLVFN